MLETKICNVRHCAGGLCAAAHGRTFAYAEGGLSLPHTRGLCAAAHGRTFAAIQGSGGLLQVEGPGMQVMTAAEGMVPGAEVVQAAQAKVEAEKAFWWMLNALTELTELIALNVLPRREGKFDGTLERKIDAKSGLLPPGTQNEAKTGGAKWTKKVCQN